jgi:hypothetical protein
MPLRLALLAVLVAGAVVLLGACGSDGRPAAAARQKAAEAPPPEPAALFLSPQGKDRGPCSAAAPCRSFRRAYRAAAPGDVVEVAAGSYGDQVLAYDRRKSSPDDVVFRPAEGADVQVRSVTFGKWTTDLGARHVTLSGLTLGGLLTQRTEDLTFENLTIEGAFWIQGASDVTMRGGSVGGTEGVHADIADWYHDCCGAVPAERVLIDGVHFHDMVMATPEDHVECLQISGGRDITVRNSRFSRCDTFDLLAGDHRTPLRGLLVEGNTFEPSTARFGESYYGLSVRSGTGVAIRGNRSPQAWAGPSPADRVENWLVAENEMPAGSCDDRITYHANRWTEGEACDPSDVAAAPSATRSSEDSGSR